MRLASRKLLSSYENPIRNAAQRNQDATHGGLSGMATRQSQLKQQMEMLLQEENRRLEEQIRQLGAVTSPGRAKRIADLETDRDELRKQLELAEEETFRQRAEICKLQEELQKAQEQLAAVSSERARVQAEAEQQLASSLATRRNLEATEARLTETVRACEEKAQVAEELERQLANQQQKAELQQFRAL